MGIWEQGTPGAASHPIPEGSPIRVSGTVCGQEDRKNSQRLWLKDVKILFHNSNNSEITDVLSRSRNRETNQEWKEKKVLVYLKGTDQVKIGNRVQIEGSCAYPSAPENPGEFDQEMYYRAKKVGLIVEKGIVTQKTDRVEVLRQGLYTLKKRMESMLYELYEEKEASVLSALLLGEKGELDEEIKDLYQDNGIIHILAISGLHISLLGMGLYQAMRKTGGGFWGSGAVAAGVMILFGIMTGGSVSTIRAVVMFLIFLGAEMTGRTYDPMTALIVTAVGILIENPLQTGQAGFLLSFLAVAGILVSENLTGNMPFLKKSGLSVSISTFLTTLPIVQRFYYQVSCVGIFLNLIILPLMPILLGMGFLSVGLSFVHREAGRFASGSVHYTLLFMEELCKRTRLVPGAVWVSGKPEMIQMALYYLVFLIFLCFFKKKRKIDLIKRLFGIILMIGILSFRKTPDWTMTVFHVGQGDGILFQMPKGSVWMVDGGSADKKKLAAYSLTPYFLSHGIRNIDMWVVTHPDDDHISGLLEILKAYQKNPVGDNIQGVNIKTILLAECFEQDESAEELIALAGKAGIPVRFGKAGDRMTSGETVFRILSPKMGDRYQKSNEGSLVAEVSYLGFQTLLCGDVEGRAEKLLTDTEKLHPVDVLKAAHHGSEYSTSEAFLEKVKPKVTVISCGKNNRYGHPHQALLDRLYMANSRIIRTDEQGAVDITVTKDGYRIAPAQ